MTLGWIRIAGGAGFGFVVAAGLASGCNTFDACEATRTCVSMSGAGGEVPASGGSPGALGGAPAAGGDVSLGGLGGSPEVVEPPPATLTLETAQRAIRLVRTSSVDLPVSIRRAGDWSGEVTLTVEGLPSGVTAEPVTLDEEANGALVRIEALGSAELGEIFVAKLVAREVDGELSDSVEIEVTVTDAPLSLDVSFATDGVLTLAEGEEIGGLGVAPDGQFVVSCSGGSGAIVRKYTIAGQVDETFVSVPPGNTGGLVLSHGDSWFVVTQSTENAYLSRLDALGAPVPSFSNEGVFGVSRASFEGLAAFSDYGIAVVSSYGLSVLAFDGSQRPEFPSGATMRTPAIDGLTRLIASVSTPTGFSLVRFLPDGTPDETFGEQGQVDIVSSLTSGRVDRIIVRDDDSLVALLVDSSAGALLVGLTEDGGVDESFGQTGFVDLGATTLRGGLISGSNFARDAAGRLIVVVRPSNGQPPVLRGFRANGSPDPTLAGGAPVALQALVPGAGAYQHVDMAYDPTLSRLVVAARLGTNTPYTSVVFRLWL